MMGDEPESRGARTRPRAGIAPGWVLLGLGLSFVAAFGIAWFLYDRYVAYERIAALHLAPNPSLLVRADLEKVAMYEPFRRHLLPLLSERPAKPRLKPRLTRLRHHTGVELGVDIRELVFSRNGESGQWIIALSGRFPKQGVVAGTHRALQEEGIRSELEPSGRWLSFDNGVRLAQAVDGVVLVASDLASLEHARVPGQGYQKLGISLEQPLGVGLLNAAARGQARVERVTSLLELGRPHRLTSTLSAAPGNSLGRADSAWFVAELGRIGNLDPNAVKFGVSGPNQLVAEVTVEGSHLDHAAGLLAQLIRVLAFSDA